MLHLQDTYPDGRSMEGLGSENLADQLGAGFSPELLDIELGNWTKKSVRELAFAAGLEKQYRLVYDPASADIHGTWMSLANSNLTWCALPLHRYHRIPGIYEPPIFLETLVACQEIYEQCLGLGKGHLGFPLVEDALTPIPIAGASS